MIDKPLTYIIQPGDTLSQIAGKTKVSLKELVATNKIKDPDKIYVGNQLQIPLQNKTELELKKIPEEFHPHRVIDNFSPKYDYVVQGDKVYYKSKQGTTWADISANTQAKKNLYEFIDKNYQMKGYSDYETGVRDLLKSNTYDYKKSYEARYNSTTAKTNSNKFIAPKTPVLASDNTQVKPSYRVAPYAPPTDNPDSITARNLWTKGINYIGRQVEKLKSSNEQVTKLKSNTSVTKNSAYNIVPGSFTGDTVKVSNRQYILPESLNLKDVTLGYRNRAQYTPIQSEAAAITAFDGFQPFEKIKGKPGTTYMGIDSKGRFKVGDLSAFSTGDMLTKTFSNQVIDFAKDKVGKYMFKSDAAHGNRSRNVPVMQIKGNNGQDLLGSLNILINKDNSRNSYGNITGGRVVVKAGNEIRLLSGSLANIESEIKALKTRQNVNQVTVYTLDNGSYNRGLRTYDKQLTSQDLKKYDLQNNGGGNFLYIKNSSAYPSDTLLTSNVRTKNDASFKTGHSLTNEQSGVVLHHTGFEGNNLMDAVNLMRKPQGNAAHVAIGTDGRRIVLAPSEKVAFHAGESMFNGRKNVNDFMVGLEFDGDTNKKPLTDAQIQSAVEYLKPIIRSKNIPLENIATHKQVRDLYNKHSFLQSKQKQDINNTDFQKVIQSLLNDVYYKKSTK